MRQTRRAAASLGLAAALVVAACAPSAPPVVSPAAPRHPDFVFPEAPDALAGEATAARHRVAWQALQAGDLRAAERGFAAILDRTPGFYPAQAGLAYLDLAREAYAQSLARFDAVLEAAPGYAPGLAGRGEVLLAQDRTEHALAAFEAALVADPGLAGVGRRVEVLRFRTLEAIVAQARRAAEQGQLDQSAAAYQRAIAASPDSALLHRELADVERARGRLDAALARASRGVELDPLDARALQTLAEVQVARQAFDAALAALARAAELDPGGGTAQRIEEVRAMATLAGLPAEYRALARAPAVTRGGLAALIGVRLEPLLERAARRTGVFITDTRDHWAAVWILAVARAGVMEVYPNYTFQPTATVTRSELATVLSRLLAIVARTQPALADRWRSPSVEFTDLAPGNLNYPAAALAVTAGVMPVLDNRTFQLSRVVSGAEAMTAIERVHELAGIGSR